MADISANMVKDLRLKTGAGMGECKKALVEADGDIEKAIELLRKKGAASAAKRADRSANEGIVLVLTTDDKKTGILIEINCETDFVGKNEGFIQYANTVANAYLNNDVNSLDDLMKVKVGTDSVEGLHNEILAKFSEKIEVRRMEKIKTNGFLTTYIHAGSRLGVLVDSNINNPDDKVKSTIYDVAMQIAAMNPSFIDRSIVSQEKVDKEIEIYKEQAMNEGKKEDIALRIAQGRLEKFFQESCLIEQAFVKDSSKAVKTILAEANPELKILSFRRYFLGEEIA
jgi:elongation factor Ts